MPSLFITMKGMWTELDWRWVTHILNSEEDMWVKIAWRNHDSGFVWVSVGSVKFLNVRCASIFCPLVFLYKDWGHALPPISSGLICCQVGDFLKFTFPSLATILTGDSGLYNQIISCIRTSLQLLGRGVSPRVTAIPSGDPRHAL